jgi:uncharacterized protein
MNRIRLADCPFVPWRNGGGRTRELLAWPTAEAWQVRVSVAEISADGPFSPYPGIDRFFAVLEGGGVTLALPSGDAVVRAGGAPIAFAGEDAPGCRLIAGPTQDLNLMVRRGARGPWRGLFAEGSLWWTDHAHEALPEQRGWRLALGSMERTE